MKQSVLVVSLSLSLILLTTACSNYQGNTTKSYSAVQCKMLAKKREDRRDVKHRNIRNSTRLTGVSTGEAPKNKKSGPTSYPASELCFSIDPESVYASNLSDKTILNIANKSSDLVVGAAFPDHINYSRANSPLKDAAKRSEHIDKQAGVLQINASPSIPWQVNNAIPGLVGLSGLLSVSMLCLAQSKTKEISRWSAKNPWKARGIIAGTQLSTGLIALTVGNQLSEQSLVISETVRHSAMIVFGTSAILYPIVNSQFVLFNASYLRRKIHDISLFTSGTILMMSLGNRYTISQEQNIPSINTVYSIESFTEPHSTFSIGEKDTTLYAAMQDPPKKKNTGVKIGLTVLAVLAYAGLTYLLAGLACTIACSGAEGASFLVFFGGEAALITLLVTSIRGIFGKKKKHKRPLETQPT